MLGIIYVWGPLWVFALLVLAAGSGILWAPIAALIAWRLAIRRGLDGRQHAPIGAACSVFLLLPWFILIIGLLRRDLTVSAIIILSSTALVYFAWFAGPILFWGHYVANFVTADLFIEGPAYGFGEPGNWLAEYSVLVVMVVLWAGSGINSIRTLRSSNKLVSVNYVMPFILTWICILVVLGYLFLIPTK